MLILAWFLVPVPGDVHFTHNSYSVFRKKVILFIFCTCVLTMSWRTEKSKMPLSLLYYIKQIVSTLQAQSMTFLFSTLYPGLVFSTWYVKMKIQRWTLELKTNKQTKTAKTKQNHQSSPRKPHRWNFYLFTILYTVLILICIMGFCLKIKIWPLRIPVVFVSNCSASHMLMALKRFFSVRYLDSLHSQ